MTKNFTILAVFVAAIGILTPAAAFAKTVTGRVTAFTPSSISVLDKEIITVGISKDTVFTKLITRKPWQEDTATTANAVRVGSFVVVHAPDTNGFVANWVQVAVTGVGNASLAANPGTAGPVLQATRFAAVAARYEAAAVDHVAEAKAYRNAPSASESKRPGGPDTATHCDRLADAARNAATAARALARDHEQMAK